MTEIEIGVIVNNEFLLDMHSTDKKLWLLN